MFKQLANVVEWEEYRDDVIFWKWMNKEIKKGSKLIIRPGQDAIFMVNGKVDGIFEDEGSFDIESQIVPFLSTLKGFKFGFNSGMRAEVLFVNTKDFQCRWGTRSPIMLQAPGLPGGMPIRANGTYTFRITDRDAMISRVAGIKQQFTVDDVKERVTAVLDQLLMKWISQEGKDMFNLQASAYDISKGIKDDLDMELMQLGISIVSFTIGAVSYPEEVQRMQAKAAGQSMVGDVSRYQQIAMADSMSNGGHGGMAREMAGAVVAAQMAAGMMAGMQGHQGMGPGGGMGQGGPSNFCPNCGTKSNGANFCPNCGNRLS